jgi:hypothetical protein
MDFSLAEASLIALRGRATSISFLGTVLGLLLANAARTVYTQNNALAQETLKYFYFRMTLLPSQAKGSFSILHSVFFLLAAAIYGKMASIFCLSPKLGMTRVWIPTINDGPDDFATLFTLYRENCGSRLRLVLDFSNCRFLRQNAVAFLGGLVRLVTSQYGTVELALDTLNSDVRRNLSRSGFLEALGYNERDWSGNTIPYREDWCQTRDSETKIVEYLKTLWLGRGWLQISDELCNGVVSQVWEIYANAFEHAQSEIGVFTCGQYYPKMNLLKLTVVDFGLGIPARVRLCLKHTTLPASEALKWAMTRGNTTATYAGYPRGVGLDLLKVLVQANQGTLEFFSDRGVSTVTMNEETHHDWGYFFGGTLVNITLNCNEHYYERAA